MAQNQTSIIESNQIFSKVVNILMMPEKVTNEPHDTHTLEIASAQ